MGSLNLWVIMGCHVILSGIQSGRCVEIICFFISALKAEMLSANNEIGSVLYMLRALYMNELFSLSDCAWCFILILRACLVPSVLCMYDVNMLYSASGVFCATMLCISVVL